MCNPCSMSACAWERVQVRQSHSLPCARRSRCSPIWQPSRVLESAERIRDRMAIHRQLSLFLVATQFLTRLPVPGLRKFETSWLTQSARYFPLVGVLVGAVNVGVWWLAGHWFPGTVSV